MAKKNIFRVLDVETAGSLGWPLIYDIAWMDRDKNGKVIGEPINLLIEEVFTNPDLMCRAFYARKYFTEYPKILLGGKIKMVKWAEFIEMYKETLEKNKVNVFCAYNAAFDIRAMVLTDFWMKYDIKSKDALLKLKDRLLEHGLNAEYDEVNSHKFPVEFPRILDIYLQTTHNILQGKSFHKTAIEKLWITPNGNIQSTAQVAWRWFSGDHEFIEHHTSLEDVIIESQLLTNCLQRKQKLYYDKMEPACIIARNVQPVEATYFHERVGETFSVHMENLFVDTFGVYFDHFKENMNPKQQWELILGREIKEEEYKDKESRNDLNEEFVNHFGMPFKQWKQLPRNFQMLHVFNCHGIEWYIPPEDLKIEMNPRMQQKYMEEKAKLEQSTNRGLLKLSVQELAEEQSYV